MLKNYNITVSDADNPLLSHRIAETFKWVFALRTKLGDPFDDDITDIIDEVVRWCKASFHEVTLT